MIDFDIVKSMKPFYKYMKYRSKTISGTPPLTFKSNGRPLKNYRIYGNTVNGESVGDLVTEGEHAGEYYVPVTISRKAKHTATLQLHDCLLSTMQFDAPEALYYAENGLTAGTYCFTIQSGYDETYGGGKTYSFTLSENVPAGGQLTFSWGSNVQASDAKISSYASAASTTAIEQVSVTEGNTGISLGTTDGSHTNVNHIHRVRRGSNNYAESAIRQFLNSSSSAGSVWTPQTKFDRPPSWNALTAGFMKDIDSEFLTAVGTSHKVTALNNVTDNGGSIVLNDMFFLLSVSETYGSLENNVNEGEPYPYYSNNSDLSMAGTDDDSNRIKYRNSNAQTWWLRSPYASIGSYVRGATFSGNIIGLASSSAFGIAPACNIELDADYKYNDRVLHVHDQISVAKGHNTLIFDVIGIDHDDVDFDITTTNIYLTEQLTKPFDNADYIDYIDYKTQKQYVADGTSADVSLETISTLSGTNKIIIDSDVLPSNVELIGNL